MVNPLLSTILPDRPGAKVMVAAGPAAVIASRREQSASQIPSFVSASFVTVSARGSSVGVGGFVAVWARVVAVLVAEAVGVLVDVLEAVAEDVTVAVFVTVLLGVSVTVLVIVGV